MQADGDPISRLIARGQSVWLDTIDRELIATGRLDALIAHGIRGVTSNPTIFEKAIAGSRHYDGAIAAALTRGISASATDVYEDLAVDDIQRAADALRPTYDAAAGADGFACLEVSPYLAHDAAATIREARRLFERVGRPNVMIKVPGTPEGATAIQTLVAEGIPVNVTLLFSVQQYEEAARAFLRGAARSSGAPASVASLFVSRIDTFVDRSLRSIAAPRSELLLGRAAIAQARLVYARSIELFAERGLPVQRPLWASTSTKDPTYRDVRYVEELVAPGTVTTLPLETFEAFRAHGIVRGDTAAGDAEDARRVIDALSDLGISSDAVARDLQRQGVEAFASSFDALLAAISAKITEVETRA